ncbi:MAG: molybdopterin molybdotransferase MoeA [Solirubrobacteraceae bacterium]
MTLVELPDARDAILALAQPVEKETVALVDALGRVLAEDVTASEAVPGFDSSAMDGFAVRANDLAGASPSRPATLRLVAESRAGAPAAVALRDGEAIAISTGAMLPAGADAVVRVEDARTIDGGVELLAAVPEGFDVRRAGEDLRAGQTVLRSGETIGPAALGVLASLGREHVACARAPRVALLLTGDELIAAGERSRPGSVRDSSSHTVGALVRCCGGHVIHSARVPDDAQATRSMIASAVGDVDALVICGGISVGAHDHVRPSLDALGARRVFWGLALKPGKPMWFGALDAKLVFGLPGNPVSAMATFALLVAPALRAMLGARTTGSDETALIDVDYVKPAGRAHAVRCRLQARDDGLHATPTGPQGSHILTSMLAADALAILDSATTFLAAGTRVPIVRLPAPWGAAS